LLGSYGYRVEKTEAPETENINKNEYTVNNNSSEHTINKNTSISCFEARQTQFKMS
jgi:hypothetical protein